MDPPATVIRPLLPADRGGWAPLWAGYNAFYERVLPAEVTEACWARFLDPAEPVHAAVAEQDGALAGLVHYLFHRSTSALAPICYLQDLFTAPAARGQGVAGALIGHVYAAAAAAGATRVYWHTHESNVVAMKLYDRVAERSGFVRYVKDIAPLTPR